MNGRIAKQLRKEAMLIAKKQFGKTISKKVQRGKQQLWERYSPIAIYKSLKKSYSNGAVPRH